MSTSTRTAKTRFEKIKKWIEEKGYSVRYGTSDFIDYDDKEIVLIKNQCPKYLIYSALHECGHLIVSRKDDYHRDYKSIVKADEIDGRHYRSNKYKYEKLKEEMSAWEEGYKLSKELKMRINKEDYDNYAAKNFVTYCK